MLDITGPGLGNSLEWEKLPYLWQYDPTILCFAFTIEMPLLWQPRRRQIAPLFPSIDECPPTCSWREALGTAGEAPGGKNEGCLHLLSEEAELGGGINQGCFEPL